MPWDLALSEHGDFIFAGNRDFAGVSGLDEIEQRMKTRMKVRRGTWVFDTQKTLGSNLFRLIGMPPNQAADSAQVFVREALRGMDEISVTNVQTVLSDTDITIIVFYRVKITGDQIDASSQNLTDEQQLEITLPISSAGGGI